MKEKPETTDWLPIDWVTDEDNIDEDGFPEMEAVIDPDGFNVPLSLVMRAQ
jgi:hypothetical protein